MAGTSTPSSPAIANDSPVLTLINKRLRALRKKLNRIAQMEDSVLQGKSLNKEQTQALSSKSGVIARIDELERLLKPLPEAINQEIEIALDKNSKISQLTETEENAENVANDGVSALSDLLSLVYFGSLFDQKTLVASKDSMLMRTHERNCCLTYDYVTDDASIGDLLKEEDLDLISLMGSLVTSRPANSRLSHKYALEKCVEHARLWLANAEQPIEPHSSVTYAGLKDKLNKIMASDYFTTNPQINPIEVAAAFSSYTYFQCPVIESLNPQFGFAVSLEGSVEEFEEESMIPQVDFAVPLECLAEDSEEEEEQSQNSDGDDIYNGGTDL